MSKHEKELYEKIDNLDTAYKYLKINLVGGYEEKEDFKYSIEYYPYSKTYHPMYDNYYLVLDTITGLVEYGNFDCIPHYKDSLQAIEIIKRHKTYIDSGYQTPYITYSEDDLFTKHIYINKQETRKLCRS